MIVISGKYRGRKLKALEGKNTRPTSARVKEDMFNILSNYFIYEGKTSLDLFGGSGALSIEGLSRGVKFAYINDHFPAAIQVIKENLKGIDQQSYALSQLDYGELLETLENKGVQVDLIYLDPPFPHIEYYYDFFNRVLNYNLLKEWGIIMTETPELLDFTKLPELSLLKYKDWKNKHLYFFRLERGV
ncbi:16S rRNA (guanine966-N2)-methyltransferase [Williamsoniiplasma somnilux]|uniref:16S rRNA (Guanine966-N2)-methyltransferase n=1 Tax=Williamsoniiplasma somnilux TaxID=215578 RepID=A0A2K8NXX4_9MOLU|nr:RsmD family RNA methyltransferase [Williamsoniiplasma somnilux]ATZ18594.1 16S rRNA (guanine966-N2)-methyltransferase [Williamsoniiplasma somnilux]